jgi:hypothetical protein
MMKAARPFQLNVILLLVALAIAALAASAGTVDDPEVSDGSGDSGGRDSHDIIKAWVEEESNTTITLRLKLTALDTISPRDDWLTLPTTTYEYYFTVSKKDYCARATVPVHGPFAALASFGLYEVTYGNSDNLSYDSVGSPGGTYMVNEASLEWIVAKGDIGSPSQGEQLTHMWAASYFQPRNENQEEMDHAQSYETPGLTYTIRGQFSQLYHVFMRATNTTLKGEPRMATVYNITIVSESTTDVEVNITNNSMPAGYYVNYSRLMPIPVPEESSVSFQLVVTVPGDAKNGSNVAIRLSGIYLTEEDEEQTTDDMNLILQVRFIPQKPIEEEQTIFTIMRDFIQDYYWYLLIVITIAIIAVVIYFVLGRGIKKDDAALHEYQAYLDSQGQKREMGET